MATNRVRMMKRGAFTLLEILVVVAIIGVLAALAVTGAMRVIEGQNESNTRTGIQVAYSILQKQWAKVVADAKKEQPSDAVNQLAGYDFDRAQIIWIKMRLMEAFPVTYSEVNSFPLYDTYIPPGRQKNIATYKKRLVGSPAEQSSACLVAALSINRGGVVLDEEKLGPFLKTDAGGAKSLVDGWGTPIKFFRFPTAFPNQSSSNSLTLNPNKSTRGMTFSDPLDPDGKLQDTAWVNKGTFESLVHPVAAGTYIIPAIVSAGQDGKLGLSAAMAPDGAFSNDNLYSFFFKVGATGN